jgi:hypothetical protein
VTVPEDPKLSTLSEPQRYALMAVRPDVQVVLSPPGPPPSPALEPAIAAAWDAAQRRAGGRLFNGRIVSVVTATPERITGRMVEYRCAVAGFADPRLAAALEVRPLSVSAVLRTPEGILFGRRDAGATYEAGLWQMPPAGSVDAGAVTPDGRCVDLAAQVAAELEEEVGLPWTRVRAFRPFALVRHAASGVHDLGVLLETDAGSAEILAARRHDVAAAAEYGELRVVPEAALAGFVAAERGRMVPAAPMFLSALGLLQGGAGWPPRQ